MLLDTSGLLCLHFSSEPLHTKACVEYQKAKVRLTHSYIIAEYVALANARRFSRSSVLDFVVDLLSSPDIETVWVDEPIYRAAILTSNSLEFSKPKLANTLPSLACTVIS
jgi:hypothetical protein